jgi:hypothetical protein
MKHLHRLLGNAHKILSNKTPPNSLFSSANCALAEVLKFSILIASRKTEVSHYGRQQHEN